MKIDVEGAELLVLNSAIETLKQGRIEIMIIEFHSHGNYIHIIKLLKELRYSIIQKSDTKSIRTLNTPTVIL
jgi:hypothetical protein